MEILYLIRRDTPDEITGTPVYWNYEFGDWGPLFDASVYTENDIETMGLPLDGRWVRFTEVPF